MYDEYGIQWRDDFYSAYNQAADCNINEIQQAAGRMKGCTEEVLSSLFNESVSEDMQYEAVTEITEKIIELSDMLYRASVNRGGGIISPLATNDLGRETYINNMAITALELATANIIADRWKSSSGFYEKAVLLWKSYIEKMTEILPEEKFVELDGIIENIRIAEPDYKISKKPPLSPIKAFWKDMFSR